MKKKNSHILGKLNGVIGQEVAEYELSVLVILEARVEHRTEPQHLTTSGNRWADFMCCQLIDR